MLYRSKPVGASDCVFDVILGRLCENTKVDPLPQEVIVTTVMVTVTVTPGPFFFIFPFSARRSRPNLDPFPLRLAPFPVQPQSRPFPVTV